MLKKLTTLLICLLLVFYGYTQNYERSFKFYKQEISLGFVKPLKSTVGFSFATEPKFSVIDKLAIGLRLEGSIWLNNDKNNAILILEGGESYTYSVVPNVDYYFTNSTFRPFVGIGYGLYFFSNSNSAHYKSTTKITQNNNTGMMARAGFEAGHFRLGVQYNKIKREGTNYSGTGLGVSENWGYIDLKLGVVIGGGWKH